MGSLHFLDGDRLVEDVLPKMVELNGKMLGPRSKLGIVGKFQGANVVFKDAASYMGNCVGWKCNTVSLEFATKVQKVDDITH